MLEEISGGQSACSTAKSGFLENQENKVNVLKNLLRIQNKTFNLIHTIGQSPENVPIFLPSKIGF